MFLDTMIPEFLKYSSEDQLHMLIKKQAKRMFGKSIKEFYQYSDEKIDHLVSIKANKIVKAIQIAERRAKEEELQRITAAKVLAKQQEIIFKENEKLKEVAVQEINEKLHLQYINNMKKKDELTKQREILKSKLNEEFVLNNQSFKSNHEEVDLRFIKDKEPIIYSDEKIENSMERQKNLEKETLGPIDQELKNLEKEILSYRQYCLKPKAPTKTVYASSKKTLIELMEKK